MSFIRFDVAVSDKAILSVLQKMADPQTRKVRVSTFEIAGIVGCAVMTVSRATKRLENAGYIKKHRPTHISKMIEYEVLTHDDP